jgi:hypothetical protein
MLNLCLNIGNTLDKIQVPHYKETKYLKNERRKRYPEHQPVHA